MGGTCGARVGEVGRLTGGRGSGPPAAIGGGKDSSFGDLHAQAECVIRFYADETVPIERRP